MKITASKVIQWVYAIYVTIINAVCTALWIVNDDFVWFEYGTGIVILGGFIYILLTILLIISLFDKKVEDRVWGYYLLSYMLWIFVFFRVADIWAGV